MLHVFDFDLLKGSSKNSQVRVFKNGVEEFVCAIDTDDNGDVLIELLNECKGGEL